MSGIYLSIKDAACPRCKQKTLDLDVRPKISSKQVNFGGMFALAIEAGPQPVAYCTSAGCGWEQWGRIEGPFVVFDEHTR